MIETEFARRFIFSAVKCTSFSFKIKIAHPSANGNAFVRFLSVRCSGIRFQLLPRYALLSFFCFFGYSPDRWSHFGKWLCQLIGLQAITCSLPTVCFSLPVSRRFWPTFLNFMIRRLAGNTAVLLDLRFDRFVGNLVSFDSAMVRRGSILRIVQQRSISLTLLDGRGGRGTVVIIAASRASRRADESVVR